MRSPLFLARIGLVLIFASALLLFVAARTASVVRIEDGQGITFRSATHVIILGWVAAVCTLASGALILRARIGWPRFFGVFVLVLGCGLTWGAWILSTARIVIEPQRITLPGFGGSQVAVAYADVSGVILVPAERNGGSDVLLYRTDGAEVRLPMGDLMRAGWADVSLRFEQMGIPVGDMR